MSFLRVCSTAEEYRDAVGVVSAIVPAIGGRAKTSLIALFLV
jgi:hypothetical protein